MESEELVREALARARQLLACDADLRENAADPAVLAALATERSSAEIVARACELYGSRSAFALRPRGADDFVRLSYTELWSRVSAFATGLAREALLGAGDFMAIVAFGGPEFVMTELAAVYLGATSLPLQTNMTPALLARVLLETKTRVVACEVEQLPLVVAALGACPSVHAVIALSSHAAHADDDARLEEARARANAPGVRFTTFVAVEAHGAGAAVPLARPGRGDDPLRTVVYTSGSTGTPKGALFPESVYVQKWLPARASSYPFLPEFPLPLPVAFVFSPLGHQMGSELVAASLTRGALTHLAVHGDVSRLFEDFRAARPTFIGFVPRVAQELYEDFRREVGRRTGWSGDAKETANASEAVMSEMRVRTLGDRLLAATSTSAPIGAEVLAFLRRCFRVPVFNLMGMTEVGGFAFDGRLRRDNVLDFRLVDAPEKGFSTTDRPYPRGELWLKTRRQVPGYFASEEATRATFTPDGYVRTGDIFELRDDEQITWIARKNQVLKLAHGKFVNTGALESTFVGQSALIEQAYVYGKSERSYLVAVLVPNLERARELLPHGVEPEPAALHALLAEELRRVAKEVGLRSYEVPRDFVLELAAFSRENGLVADNGKPSLAKLEARYVTSLDALYAKLETERAERLRALTALPLGAPVAEKLEAALAAVINVKVSPAERRVLTFTELGGDSINAVALAALLEEEWRLHLPIGLILSPSASLGELARYLERSTERSGERATVESVHGALATVLRADELTLARFMREDELTRATQCSARPLAGARTVFVTGARGFLGRFLLLELLERAERVRRVVGLVRARDDAAARARVRASLATDPELSTHFERLIARGTLEIVAGDLMLPELGLSRPAYDRLASEVGTVVHAGALVNHALGYDELFEPNVRGTAEIARFVLAGAPKSVVFVSSVGLAEGVARDGVRESESARALWPERARFGGAPGYGYSSTKWASELLLGELAERFGVPVQVVRATNLMAHSRYHGQINADDFLCRLLAGLAATHVAPASFYAFDSGTRAFDGVPVDAAARAVVEVALGEPRSATYHLVGPSEGGVSLDAIVECLVERGSVLERIGDYAAWYRRFTQQLGALGAEQRRHSPLAIAERWEKPRPNGVRLASTALAARLAESGAELPVLTRSFIHKSLNDLSALGVL